MHTKCRHVHTYTPIHFWALLSSCACKVTQKLTHAHMCIRIHTICTFYRRIRTRIKRGYENAVHKYTHKIKRPRMDTAYECEVNASLNHTQRERQKAHNAYTSSIAKPCAYILTSLYCQVRPSRVYTSLLNRRTALRWASETDDESGQLLSCVWVRILFSNTGQNTQFFYCLACVYAKPKFWVCRLG